MNCLQKTTLQSLALSYFSLSFYLYLCIMKHKTVALHTLGCKLNFSESSDIGRHLQAEGYKTVDFREIADIYVVNTCTVTDTAEKKCRQAIRQAVSRNPRAIVAVIGCFSEVKRDVIAAMDGVHIVLGNEEKFRLPQYLKEFEVSNHPAIAEHDINQESAFHPAYSSGDRTRSFFKIQDGCDYFCTYCNVPSARGRSRSGTIAETLKTASEIDASGMKEMILTGVNTGDFGRKNNEKFIELLVELEKLEHIKRIRISSIEPELLTDEIIDLVAGSPVFLPHFHLPLQSGSDMILKQMNRKYDTSLFREKVRKIKERIPHCCIAIDLITGFPGETGEFFEETLKFIETIDVSYMHIFPYSVRPGTQAARMPLQVNFATCKHRSAVLHELSERKKTSFYRQHEGTIRKVLFESEKHGAFMFGFTDNYIRVKTTYDKSLINEIVEVLLLKTDVDGICNIRLL